MPDTDHIDLKTLRYFLVVAEAGNIGRAASILDIHPATLGRTITTFEKDLGFELFKKHAKGIVLSGRGQSLLEIGPDILKNAERIHALGEKYTDKQSLVVGVPFSLAPLLVGPIYSEIKAHLPKTLISFHETTSLEIETKTINGSVDVALMYDPPDVYSLVSEPILEEAMLFVYPPSWDFKPPERPILVREIQGLPVVLTKAGFSERRYIGRIEQQSGMHLTPIIEAASSSTINTLVNSGLACTIALAHSVAREVSRGALVTHPIGKPLLKMRLNLVASKGVLGSENVEVSMECIRNAIKTLVQAGRWGDAELLQPRHAQDQPSHSDDQ